MAILNKKGNGKIPLLSRGFGKYILAERSLDLFELTSAPSKHFPYITLWYNVHFAMKRQIGISENP